MIWKASARAYSKFSKRFKRKLDTWEIYNEALDKTSNKKRLMKKWRSNN